MHGAYRPRHSEDKLARLEVSLSVLVILPFDKSDGMKFGALKPGLEAKGEPLDHLDLQIASIAIENQCPLLTNNSRHFSRIEGLQLVNWLA